MSVVYLAATWHQARSQGSVGSIQHQGCPVDPSPCQLPQVDSQPLRASCSSLHCCHLLHYLQAMAADPEHYSKLVASVAPRVIDMDNVKMGLLCQLFGGVSKSTAAALGGHTTSRYGGDAYASLVHVFCLWLLGSGSCHFGLLAALSPAKQTCRTLVGCYAAHQLQGGATHRQLSLLMSLLLPYVPLPAVLVAAARAASGVTSTSWWWETPPRPRVSCWASSTTWHPVASTPPARAAAR